VSGGIAVKILKVALVMAAGLGSTWAARVTTDTLLGAPAATSLVQAAQQPAPAGGPPSPPAVPEMSREEMEAELKRAQREISGGPARDEELREFRPTRPLPADLAIALPSDI
jgi:hypothetical protein